jgi:hypothetical protein
MLAAISAFGGRHDASSITRRAANASHKPQTARRQAKLMMRSQPSARRLQAASGHQQSERHEADHHKQNPEPPIEPVGAKDGRGACLRRGEHSNEHFGGQEKFSPYLTPF